MHVRRLVLLLLAGGLLLAGCDAFRRKAIYWGAWVSGSTYGLDDAPWEPQAITTFEQHAGKTMSILHWGQPWWTCNPTCRYQTFQDQVAQYEAVRQRGLIPLVDWASWDFKAQSRLQQPAFALSKIIGGEHDDHIRQWATEAKNWGHPFFLRFNWEMNGDWFPWSETQNGNRAGEFVQAWRHVHDIFTQVGASNVTWVWCPHVETLETVPLEPLYPGDAYVDWIGLDGYNWGLERAPEIGWQSFQEIFEATYNRLVQLSPHKPLMIAEIASTETGGSKAKWITDMLVEQLPQQFPKVKAVVWFNWNADGMDWVIESSPSAQEAFAKGIAATYYAHSEFAELNTSPIPPLY